MRTWQSIIRDLRRHGAALPEPLCDAYELEPPTGEQWPRGLPDCPLLQEFYHLTDGGTLGAFSFSPLGELEETTTETREWMESVGVDEFAPEGRWLVFGYNEYSHRLIWDADRDSVVLYDSDGGDVWSADDTELAYDGSQPAEPGRVTMAQFFANLVPTAANPSDESAQLWADAVRELDRLAGTIPPTDQS